MNKFFSRLAVGVVLLLTAAGAFAQNYPMPGNASSAAVICGNCPGKNSQGASNAGLKTFPYSSPIKAHVGRYVDSVNTSDWQSGVQNGVGYGFRTARAAKVLVAPTQRASAPPRIYMQIGSALAAYSIDTFFTTKLPAGPVDINSSFVPDARHSEKAIRPDAFVYPEADPMTWKLYQVDSQDRLFDFDYDDRGYVYPAYSFYGWAVLRDEGTTFRLIKQVVDSGANLTIPDISVKGILSLKSGSDYYVLIFNPEQAGKVAVYNVTDPTSVTTPREFVRRNQAIRYVSKNAGGDRIAIVDVDNKLQFYDTTSYLNGGSPLVTFTPSPGKQFLDVSFDKDGNAWAIEDAPPGGALTTNVLWKLSASGATYTATTFNVYGQAYGPKVIEVNDGYISIIGLEAGNQSSQAYNPRIYKITNGEPQALDTKNFFRNYYHMTPSAEYAMPEGYTNLLRDMMTVKWNNKVYLIYADHGLGDVYELQGGDSITASYGASFGSANPNSRATQAGPYVGDPISFSATSSNTGFPINLSWNFGNPEAGSANSVLNQTGQTATFRYGGYSTAAQITAPKTVSVQGANDSSIADSLTINLKVPTPRVVVSGASTVVTAPAANLAFVAGDTFTDGSDGSVESHTATYLIDSTSTATTPTGTVPVGALGNHTLTFTAAYGPYSPTYNAQIANVAYSVRPFVVTMNAPTANGNTATYTGTARRTSDASIILPSQTTWNVTWTLKNGATVIKTESTSPAIGTIPNFLITDKSTITNGSTVELSVTIPSAGLGTAAQSYGTSSASQAQITPDPAITYPNGTCGTTGAPCTLTAASSTNASTAAWTYSWKLNGNPTGATTATYSPTFSQPGTYVVELTVASGIFTATTQQTLNVQGPPCGGLPTDNNMFIGVYGLSSGCRATGTGPSCQVGETIQLSGTAWGYVVQQCDVFSWNFGDGQTGSGQSVQHTFPGSGPYTVTMTVSNSSGSKSYTATVTFGGNPNPGGGCSAPGVASMSYSGNQGCGPGVACKTGETITFTASRGGAALQSCDSVSWNFGDFSSSASTTAYKAYSTAGTYTVSLNISNSQGSAQTSATIQVSTGGPTGGGCNAVDRNRVDFRYDGQTTGCAPSSFAQCRRGETIAFSATGFGYTYQSCDQFLWSFGDGGTSTEKNPTHVFNGGASGYEVTLKVYNSTDPTGTTVARTIRLTGGDPAKPTPEISAPTAPASAAKNVPITFRATSNIAATGWTWNFGDGTIDTSQASTPALESTITHSYATAGQYVVTVSARNAEDQFGTAGQATKQIEILNTPEHRFLVPVVTRSTGFGGSTWRTDVQVFNPDPTVSASNPMTLNVTFKGVTKQIPVASSTFISEDFLKYFEVDNTSGPMTISVLSSYQPQIWTRTYNQAASGTFGQFIPAILLSGNGTSANALPTTETYQFLAGLRTGSKYRTNIGLVNPMDRELTITITAYDETYSRIGETQKKVSPFDLVQFTADSGVFSGLVADKPFMVRITVPKDSWLIAYGSMIDQVSQDPTYVAAVSDVEVTASDFADLIVPGVGHTGPWRSDVTIFNSDYEQTSFDLAYYNDKGELAGEAKNIPLKGRNFIQLDDLLKAGYLSPAPADGVGSLRIRTVPGLVSHYPIAYSRTYNFNGTSSFGQGISAFSTARANVKPSKPAFIPAVRNDSSYYTNIGLVNLSSAEVTVKVTLLRFDTGAEAESLPFTMKPYQSVVGNILQALGGASRGSLKVSIEGNTGSVWAFASVIDKRTGDPEYLAATPTP